MHHPRDRADRQADAQAGPDELGDGGRVAPLPTVPVEKYAVQGELGRGGLGRVMRALDKPMNRAVAVKELLSDDPELERRFVREALITARIDHPAIVPVYEAGRWPDGKPFYAMRLISGQQLTTLARGQLGLRERLGLLSHVVTIAEAVAYAHSRGVIHRDIKPDNAIIGPFGEAVLIDWGIAAELDADGRVVEMRPGGATPLIVGTPAFMAPEQAAGEPVDVRADIYALGGLLYFVLAGTSPGAPLVPLRSKVAPDEELPTRAVPPAWSVVGDRVVIPLDVRRPDVPPELLAIVRKAMAPVRDDRYASAKAFVEDLKRFQTGQMVSAHRYSLWSRLERWTRRHRALVTSAIVALVAVGVVGAVSVARVVRAQHIAEAQRAVAERQRQTAEASANELLLLNARAALQTDPTLALAWLKRYPTDGAGFGDVPAVARDAISRGVAEHVWRVSRSSSEGIAFSPDGRWLAAGSVDRMVQLWNPDTGVVRVLAGHSGPVNDVEFSPDGRLLVSGSYDHTVRLWQLDGDGGRVSSRLLGRHDGSVLDVAFSPDGRWVASAGKDNLIRLWNVATGATRTLRGHTLAVWAIAFAPDGATLASGSSDKTVRIWDLASGRARVLSAPEPLLQLAYAADGRAIFGAGESAIERWDLATGRREALPHVATTLECLAVAPRGGLVAFGGDDGLVHVWDAVSGQLQTLVGHHGGLEFLRFSPDGARLASSSQDGTVRLWRVAARAERVLHVATGGSHSIAFSPDGSELAVGGRDGVVRRWPVAGGRARLLTGHRGAIDRVEYLPGGHALVSMSSADHTLRLWDLDRQVGRVLPVRVADYRLGIARDGSVLALREAAAHGLLLELPSGRVRCRFEGTDVGHMTFSPDGQQMAYSDAHEVRLLRPSDCTSRLVYAHDAAIDAVVFSPDGVRLASSDVDRSIKLIELGSGRVRTLAGHDMEVYDLAFSADGRLLASASEDRTARVWDVASGTALRVLRGHEHGVTSVGFTRDGKALFTAGPDHTIRLWSLTDERVRILRGHEDAIYAVALAPDGRSLASASADGTVWLWTSELPPGIPTAPAPLRAWLQRATTAEIDAVHPLQSPIRARN